VRPDLLALTPAAVASLSNAGLVKRAQRESAEGKGPSLEEAEDGTVSGIFPDGTLTRLPPGVPLRDSPCSCGSAAVCRHRVGVALAYRGWIERAGGAQPSSQDEWSPGSIDDEALLAALGRRALDRARALAAAGCDVEVRRSRGPESVPVASLPTTSVQFLVPRDLAYARCTCVALQNCEHVALAAWAFREADKGDPKAESVLVHLSAAADAHLSSSPLEEASSLGAEVLLEGVVHLTPALSAKVARAQSALDEAGMTWPSTIISDLASALDDYRQRSARYRPFIVASLLAELAARVRAGSGRGELPPPFVLGQGEAPETALSHLRLTSLGGRLFGQDRSRGAEVYLTDQATGVVLVLEKEWRYQEAETPEDGPRLGERSVIPGVRLKDLAMGEVVTSAAKRMANRAVRFGTQRRGMTSVTPQGGAWSSLEPPLLVTDVTALAGEIRSRPPRVLRPRVLAESVRVVAVAEVRDVAYSPGDQALSAVVVDRAGNALTLVRRHRSVAPFALDALATALGSPLRFVSGDIRMGHWGMELDPIALVGDRMVVPDLSSEGGAAEAPLGEAERETTPLAAAVREAWGCLEEGVHQGLLRLSPTWHERAGECAARCDALGLRGLAEGLSALLRRVQAAQTGGAPQDAAGAVSAWRSAGVRLCLMRERVSG
jgi:hypothetical protein